jgi:hypothetical protein
MIGKTVMSRIVGLGAISAVAVLAAVGWWRLWMYHGWFGPPARLRKFWPGIASGERSYDARFVEMFAVLFILMALSQSAFRKLRLPEQQAPHASWCAV